MNYVQIFWYYQKIEEELNKNPKIFNNKLSEIIKNLPFKLTNSQKNVLSEINFDLKSGNRMFRIIQGDVGSGKTIVFFSHT